MTSVSVPDTLSPTTEKTIQQLLERVASAREKVFGEVERRLLEPGLRADLRKDLELLLARVHLDRGEFAEALRFGRKVLEWAIGQDEHLRAGNAHNTLGLTYWKLGDLPQALESFSASLQEAQTAGNPELELRSSMNLGLVHSGQKQWDAAARIYRTALGMAEVRGDQRILGVTAHNLGCTLWERDGATDEALELTRQAFACKLPFGEPATLAYTANNLVGILRDRGEWDAAHRALDDSAPWVEAAAMPGPNFYFALNAGYLHLALENPRRDDAFGFAELERALKIAQKGAMLDEEGRAYEYLAKAFAERERFKEAHDYLHRYSTVRDKYLAEQTAQRIENLRSASEIQRLEREHRIESVRRREVEALNRQLSELAEGKDQLLRLIGHDLRGYLSGILGMADLILETGELSGETASCAGDIVSAARATLGLLEEILDYGRLIADGSAAEHPVDLITESCEVIDRLRSTFAAKRQRIEFFCHKDAVRVASEPAGFRRVLENLLTNASKFSPPGTSTKVLIEQTGSIARVLVCDRGPGIPTADRGELFKPGKRLAARPTGGEPSAGVGLYLAKEIAQKIGADLHFEPTLGGGATFVITFPFAS
jgi:signal transduction histidine kinase